METSTSASRYDIAAFMALMNILKINLSLDRRPEVYRTLLAVLVDYDPGKTGNKERVQTLTLPHKALKANILELANILDPDEAVHYVRGLI